MSSRNAMVVRTNVGSCASVLMHASMPMLLINASRAPRRALRRRQRDARVRASPRRMAANLEHPALNAPQTISVTSTAFAPGKAIPREFSGYGENVSPPLKLAGLPPDAQALAIVVDDPDAPNGTFTHWTAWDLQNATEIPRAADVKKLKGTQGKNGTGK